MGIVLQFPRGHMRASGKVRPKTAGSASWPTARRASEKTKKCSDGILRRVFQFDGAEFDFIPVNSQAAAGPPTALIMDSTDLSISNEYSHSVNKSSLHVMEIVSSVKIVKIHDMGPPKPKDVARRLEQAQMALGVKSADLCREIGIKPNRWSQYMPGAKGGPRAVTMDVALRLKHRYGITTDWVYAGDPTNLPDKIRAKISPTAA